MPVKVKYIASISEITGQLVEHVDVGGETTLRELLALLSERHPGLGGRVFRGDALADDIIVLVNGRSIDWLNGLETKIREGDEVTIMPPAGGGTD